MVANRYLCPPYLCMIEFKLKEHEFIPLNDLLKVLNLVGTGGEANIRITAGEILVNGTVELQKRKKLRPGDIVQFNDHLITVC